MQFRRLGVRKRPVRATLDMTPMIDCVFQLLIFFMLSSSFVAQSSINIEMPKAAGAVVLEQKDLSVTLAYGEDGFDGKGVIYVDNDVMDSMEALSERLRDELIRAQADGKDLAVFIRPDARTVTGRLVEVLGITRSVGITKYRIAALPPGQAS